MPEHKKAYIAAILYAIIIGFSFILYKNIINGSESARYIGTSIYDGFFDRDNF